MVMNDKSPTRLSVTRSGWSSSSSSITSNNQQQEKVIAIVTQFHDIMKLKVIAVFHYLDLMVHFLKILLGKLFYKILKQRIELYN